MAVPLPWALQRAPRWAGPALPGTLFLSPGGHALERRAGAGLARGAVSGLVLERVAAQPGCRVLAVFRTGDICVVTAEVFFCVAERPCSALAPRL